MCGEDNKDKEREEKRDKFREELHEFICDRMTDIHAEDMSEALIYEATNVTSFWFGCYLHMLGFLTKALNDGLEEKFDNIRTMVKEAKEEQDAANPM